MEWKHRFFHLAIVLLRLTGDGLSCRRNHIGLPPHLRDSGHQKVHILFIEESIIKIIKFIFYLGNNKMKIHTLLVHDAQVWWYKRCNAEVYTPYVKRTTIWRRDKTIEKRCKEPSRGGAEWRRNKTSLSANFRSTILQHIDLAPSLYMLTYCKNLAFWLDTGQIRSSKPAMIQKYYVFFDNWLWK